MFWASSKAKTVFRWTSFQFFLPKAFRFFFFFLFSEFMINGGLSKTATWFQTKTMIKGPCRWYFCSIFNNNWYESAIVQRIIVLLFECLAIGAALSYLFHWSCQSNIQQRRENGNCLMEFQRTGVHECTLRYCWSRLISYSLARRNLILCMVRLTDWGCWENGAISKTRTLRPSILLLFFLRFTHPNKCADQDVYGRPFSIQADTGFSRQWANLPRQSLCNIYAKRKIIQYLSQSPVWICSS